MKRFVQWFADRISFYPMLALAMFCIAPFGGVRADGPVPPGSLPGGVNVVDADDGSGEQWGRAGGRTIQFTVNDLAGFTALGWGIVSPTAPGAAFDGSIDDASEIMAFDSSGSNLPGGEARWTGQAQIELVDQFPSRVVTLPTRFILRVTNDAGNPVPLVFVSGEAFPGIDVKTSNPFSANLRFEAKYPASIGGNDAWWPLLDLFDSLPTDPAGGGVLAQTSLNTGFYFEAQEALSLVEHDLNISAKVDAVKADTEFLKIDTVGRFQGLAEDLSMLKAQVSGIPTDDPSDELSTIIDLLQDTGQSPATPDDVQSAKDELAESVQSAKDELTEILLVLFGLSPCPPEAGPLCDTAKFISDLATQASVDMVKDELPVIQEKLDILQETLDAVPASTELKVEVVEISNGNKKSDRQWLLKTTRDGIRVDAALTTLMVFRDVRGGPPEPDDLTAQVTVTPVTPGVQELFLALPKKGRKDVRAYLFEVFLDGEPPATGSALAAANHAGGDDDNDDD